MSNLPPLAFQALTEFVVSVEIGAPLEEVWKILIDLQSYPLWNPYHCSVIIVDGRSHKPTEDPSLRAPAVLALAVQTPATLDNAKQPVVLYEHITLVDHANHRIIWGGGRLPSIFRAEHAQALSATSDGKTLYEVRHAFGGLSGYLMRRVVGGTMPQGLQATVDALKKKAEGRA
ncbi:hypothetical protein BD311DRAFT_804782 [Dichomitus squalens]|uniref:SRPBCC domain-containing protein n=1 Tax=Dichomitus squalens TaxID=114155 RepID=A0A4Q9MTP9_9APHY|nr:hypothetical protein BD311DRAFT_804782 [Dichomitus squalens]